MDFNLIFRTLGSLFSFDPKNMRFFNFKRFFAVAIFLPLFLVNLVGNRIFMLFDYLFFFKFTRVKVHKAAFIVAVPRSATTYLFHKLTNQKEKTTAMKLWEIAYAPSILQKYIVLGVLKFDALFGSPLKKFVLFVESKMLKKFKQIHVIGLNLPEEDEALLLWNMSTVYLNFFYPDTTHFDDYFRFDDCISEKKRKRIMKFYYRCVQRHCYVFNRSGSKFFVSKNPAFMSKIKTLHHFFPNAIMLNINRNPAKTIPSTMNLSNAAYSFFTSRKPTDEVNERTKQVVIDWYKMAHKNLATYFPSKTIEIDFKKLVNNDRETQKEICDLLEMSTDIFDETQKTNEPAVQHLSQTTYKTIPAKELDDILTELPFLNKYCDFD